MRLKITFYALLLLVVSKPITTTNTAACKGSCSGSNKTIIQKNAPWHLARISHRSLNTTSKNEFSYQSARDGSGVTIYVFDSGVDTSHAEFSGRARIGADFIDDGVPDNDGHGTECASLVNGKTVGVAKKAQIVSVKVTYRRRPRKLSDAFKFVLNDAKKNPKFKSVISMSVGIENAEQETEDALTEVIRAGITVIAAAGNGAHDPCKLWPALRKDVITVSGMDKNDRWGNESSGKCVDILAPSDDILVAYYNPDKPNNHGKLSISGGSSDATPIVAGVVAGYLSEKPMSPAEVRKVLIKAAGKNVIKGVPKDGTPNLLVYNNDKI
ncbi:hypothetical protein K7432_008291 [Basidiobolus ranarum]|uniref:Peptidase S8/S53 domain-containing protein n=1 Tax=Basidiobolus ranarum TaxID=34480 RepID=A0ABR2VYT9_9FUNG